MLRLVDAPAAIAGRCWPTSVRLDQLLRIEDPDLPGNTGTWLLRVKDGAGSLTPDEMEIPLLVDAGY